MSRVNDEVRSSPKAAKILLVDDHPVVRERLTEIINLEADLRVCGEAADHAGAMEAIGVLEPDLIIIDLALKKSHGLDLIKDIRVRYPQIAMLVVSMHEESVYAERVIRAGARGYITKQEATRNILMAIRQILRGSLYLSERATANIAARISSNPQGEISPIDQLTDRELRIFELLGQGRAVRQIADEMHLDAKTVETYRARIRSKLGLKDANEVLQRAISWTRVPG